MKLLTALQSEILKTKRTASLYLTVIGAMPIPAIFVLNVLTGGGDLEAVRKNGLNAIFELGAERCGLVFFPMFVILVCTLLPQIEYRNNTWKQVFAAPQTKSHVFVAKFLNINLLVLLFLTAHLVFMTLAMVATNFIEPSLDLFSQPFNATGLLASTANTYVAILALCAFQFWLGLRFRNFIVSTAVGFALWFTGMIMMFEFDPSILQYFPYTFQGFAVMPNLSPKMTQVAWTSVGCAMLFLMLGFLDFRRRRLSA